MEASDLARRLDDFSAVATDVLHDVKALTDQQTKHWIVSPFLVTLGWDPQDKKQVFLDLPTKDGLGMAHYALLDAAGKPRLVIEVHRSPDAEAVRKAAEKARAVAAPLFLVTNGEEFALSAVSDSGEVSPLFVYALKELAPNSEALLGLTVEYRLSETGIQQLRKTAIRMAVLQMLEENSERTFDAMVDWVQSQVAPGALDDATDQAIREATSLWLSEEHHSMPAFAPAGDGKRHHELRVTGARDWEAFPRGPPGTFQYRFDNTKTLDLRQSPKEVKEALRVQGFRTPTATSFGGFYYSLRQKAGLPNRKA
jgi:hypothetical protein